MSTADPQLLAEAQAYYQRYTGPRQALLAAIEEAKQEPVDPNQEWRTAYQMRGVIWLAWATCFFGGFYAIYWALYSSGNNHSAIPGKLPLGIGMLAFSVYLWKVLCHKIGRGMTKADRLRERLKALEANERRMRYSPVRDAMLSAGGLAATLDAMSSNPTDARQGMVALAMIELQKQRNMNVRNAIYDSAAEEARMRALGESIADAMMARVAERQNPPG